MCVRANYSRHNMYNSMLRPDVSASVDEFLERASQGSEALLVEGEAGIGKTALFLSVLDQARARGFRVLVARPTSAESEYAYASLIDLLRTVDHAVWAALPSLQRR